MRKSHVQKSICAVMLLEDIRTFASETAGPRTMGAKTKDPSPDLWDARDDRLTAVDISEAKAV